MFSNLRLVVPFAIFEMQELCLHRNYRSCKIQEDQVALKTCLQLLKNLWTRQQKAKGPFVYLNCLTSLMRRILKIDRLEFKLILKQNSLWVIRQIFYIGDSWGFKHTKLYSTYCFHTKSSLVIILLVGISYPLTFTIGYTNKQKWHKNFVWRFP